jgi:hypothetical protein
VSDNRGDVVDIIVAKQRPSVIPTIGMYNTNCKRTISSMEEVLNKYRHSDNNNTSSRCGEGHTIIFVVGT